MAKGPSFEVAAGLERVAAVPQHDIRVLQHVADVGIIRNERAQVAPDDRLMVGQELHEMRQLALVLLTSIHGTESWDRQSLMSIHP